MSSRSSEIFIMPSDVDPLLVELRRQKRLVILVPVGNAVHVLESGERLNDNPAYELFLADARPDAKAAPQPAQNGWARLLLPQLRDNRLSIALLGARSDWYDHATNTLRENPTSFTVLRDALVSCLGSSLHLTLDSYRPGRPGD